MDARGRRRRRFLAGAAGFAGAALAGTGSRGAPPAAPARYLGCRRIAEGSHVLAGFDAPGGIGFQIPLPGRGHGAALRSIAAGAPREAVVVARRPGTFALVVDLAAGELRRRLECPPGRHFYGHAAYSADGRWLFTTENDFARGRGVIGVRDAGDGYRRVDELPSHGVGPHELRLMPDGNTLAVANGGIRTHPASGRTRLNLDRMRPSLALVATRDGTLVAEATLAPALHRLSIRHLDVAADGRVAVAMQYQGDAADRVPLLALYADGELHPLPAPEALERRLRHYTGSVAFDAGATLIAATSPRGNLVAVWDCASGTLASHAVLGDCCGVAPSARAGEFLVTTGTGAVALLDGPSGRLRAPGGWASRAWLRGAWDNHVLAAPG